MFKLRNALIAAQDEIALSVIEENGKPLNAAKIDVQKFLNFYFEIIHFCYLEE